MKRIGNYIKACARVGYPCLLHFVIAQLVSCAGLICLTAMGKGDLNNYYHSIVLFTAAANVITVFFGLLLYRYDKKNRRFRGCGSPVFFRRLGPANCILLLLMGAGLSQYANMFVRLFASYLNYEEYSNTVAQISEGKSLLFMIICLAVISPVGEELIFRWLIYLRLRDYIGRWPAIILSALIFGIYHGNLVQAVYAFILGIVFAYLLEMTGDLLSCILLHVGANSWSYIWQYLAEELIDHLEAFYAGTAITAVLLTLLAVLILGTVWFTKKYKGEQWQIQ